MRSATIESRALDALKLAREAGRFFFFQSPQEKFSKFKTVGVLLLITN